MSSSASVRPRLWMDRRGSALVEFAIVSGVFMMVLVGILDVGRYEITFQSVRAASAEAARLATVAGAQAAPSLPAGNACPMTDSALLAGIGPRTALPDTGSLTLTCAQSASSSGVQTVTVTATYGFRFVVPILARQLSLTATSSLSY